MNDFSPFYSPFAPGLMMAFLPFILIVVIWTVVVKGFALWHAARNSQKEWFVALLIINTLGILEIVYLVWFRSDTRHSHSSHTPAHHSSTQV